MYNHDNMISPFQFLDEDRLRDQIDRLITAKLMEMQPKNIIAVGNSVSNARVMEDMGDFVTKW